MHEIEFSIYDNTLSSVIVRYGSTNITYSRFNGRWYPSIIANPSIHNYLSLVSRHTLSVGDTLDFWDLIQTNSTILNFDNEEAILLSDDGDIDRVPFTVIFCGCLNKKYNRQ